MNKNKEAIDYLFSIMEQGNIRDDYEQEMFEVAIESMVRESKILSNMKIAYECKSCGQIISAEEINVLSEEKVFGTGYQTRPIESVEDNDWDYTCPRCGLNTTGKNFKRVK
jgi:Zn finger protein HypA/HybF involved in hydrogenase expression